MHLTNDPTLNWLSVRQKNFVGSGPPNVDQMGFLADTQNFPATDFKGNPS